MKNSAEEIGDELRVEYDLSPLQGGRRGKYLVQAESPGNLVAIDPDLVSIFPDAKAVNRALRLLVETARHATTE